jgi:hypothetical protein
MGSTTPGLVSLAALKAYAASGLSARPMLRRVILSERDYMTPEEYLAKMETWLRLLDSETRS